MEQIEEKVCDCCRRQLPLSAFRKSRWGGYTSHCNLCQSKKSAQTKNKRRTLASAEGMTFPEFEGKTPQDVISLMTRAKAWLTLQGFDIKLSGVFREVKVRAIKFEL